MNKIKIHLGYEAQTFEHRDFKSFDIDLTTFPALFIDYNNNYCGVTADPITLSIISQIKDLDKKNRTLHTVIIDKGRITHNSAMPEGTYKKNDPGIMIKRLTAIVAKRYEKSLQDESYLTHHKYVVIVKGINGLEALLTKMMSMLGAVGVYLIMADNSSELEGYSYLKEYLYGQITYASQWDTPAGVGICPSEYGPSYGIVTERFKPEYKCSKDIYSDFNYKKIITREPTPIEWLFSQL